MAFLSSDRRVSNLTPSPQSSLRQQQQDQQQQDYASYLTHSHQNASSARSSPSPTIPKTPRCRISHEQLDSSKLSAMSVYLQEKLLRERKNESGRSSSRTSNERVGAIAELRATQNSPRSPSGSGNGDPVKKKSGFSLKEMEQTLTSLHKQNFDLKLELYHRRERQANLEEQCETLEKEKQELDELNAKLMSELDMRDKAVEEAVSMIVTLEAQLEQAVREREMARRLEEQTLLAADSSIQRALSYASSSAAASSSYDETPKAKRRLDTSRPLTHTPSFLSERNEHTENLRNVFLSNVGGLPRMPEDVDGDYADPVNRSSSPSLSVLSESSFLSIYGRRNESCASSIAPEMHHPIPSSMPPEPPAHVQQVSSEPSPPIVVNEGTMQSTSSTSASTLRASIIRTNSGPARVNTPTEYIDTNSPLQRLEKMEIQLQAPMRDPRPRIMRSGSLNRPFRMQEYGRREHRRVNTDVPFSGEMGSHANMPPTPDTISTSTLRRYKHSSDTSSEEMGSPVVLGETRQTNNNVALQTPQIDTHQSYFSNRLMVPARCRSTDGSTLSGRGRHSMWGDSDTSDEDMDIDGNDSASLQDCWLRESLRSTGTMGYGQPGGRVSPDLFHFPSTANGWSTTDMFGRGGQFSPVGLLSSALPYGMGSLPVPPPLPNRQSSLHAQTGPTQSLAPSSPRPEPMEPATPVNMAPSRSLRSPRMRTDSDCASPMTVMNSAQKKQVHLQLQDPAEAEKSRHYPPNAISMPRKRVLGLFRRSGSQDATAAMAALSKAAAAASPVSAPATEPVFAAGKSGSGPSKMFHELNEKDKGSRESLDVQTPVQTPTATHTSEREVHAEDANSVGTGSNSGRKKWLSLGRRTRA